MNEYVDEYVHRIMSSFTPRTQQVLALARKEAGRFNHNFIGTEHILLGMIKLGQGVAVNILVKRLGFDLVKIRLEVEQNIHAGPDQAVLGNIPYTPRVKKVLSLAVKEAKALNHTYIGTEHLLLGLLREGDGIAGRVLTTFGCDRESICQEILKELDPNFQQQTATERKNVEKPPIKDLPKRYIHLLCQETDDTMPPEVVVAVDQAKLGLLSHLMSLDYFKQNRTDGFALLHSVILETDEQLVYRTCVSIYKQDVSPESFIGQTRKLFSDTDQGSVQERRLGTFLQMLTGKPVRREIVLDFLKTPPPASS